MRNLDILNERLTQYNLPNHRSVVSDSLANIDWLKKHLTKRNEVDAETLRLLNLSAQAMFQKYQGEGGEE